MIESIMVIILTIFGCYLFWRITRNLTNTSRKRADAWTAVAKALLAKTPQEIDKVLNSHNQFLDEHICRALSNRKQDLEIEIEKNKELNLQRKKNDIKCN